MSEQRKVPKLRFPEFTDDWEQREFSSIAERISKTSQSSASLPSIEFEDIISEQGLLNKDLYSKKNVKSGIKFECNDILFGKLRPYLKNWLFANFTGVAVGDFWVLRGENISPLYLYYLIQTDSFMAVANTSTGTKMPRSDWKLVSSSIFFKPTCKDEQSKIGNLFRELDSIITLHQRKYDSLVNVKKAMFEKLFPKNGETVPEIRFKGFTDTWEQRKFGDTIQERREKSTKENEDTLLSCAINGIFLNSDLFSHFRGSSNIGYLKIRKNDLILSAQNLHLGNCNVNLTYDHGIVSPAYKVYELVNCYPYFMQAWVKKDCTKQFFLKAATEGASVCRKNIVWEDLYKQNILIPSYEEQVLIGDYFYKIDNLITLHQRRLEKLKNIKKSCLEKMFV